MPAPSLRPPRSLLLVLLASLLLKLGLLFAIGDIAPVRDERRYREVGISIAAGEGLKYTNKFWDDLHSPPLYPFLMGLVTWLGGGPFEVKLLQVFLSTLGAWFLYLLARRWLDARTALWSAALVAFYPTLVAFTHYNWNETVFLFLFLASLLALFRPDGTPARPKRMLGAGLLLGLTALCRAELAYWLPLALAWIVWVERRPRALAQCGALLGGVVLAMLPWWIYVERHYDGFVLVSTGESSMWHFSYNAFPPDTNDLGMSGEEGLDRDAYRADARPKVRDQDPIRRAAREKELGLQFARENPGLVLERFGTRIALLLYPTSFLARHVALDYYTRGPTGEVVREPFARSTKVAVVWLTLLSYVGLSWLGVLGWAGLPRSPARTLVLLTCAYFLAVYGMAYAVTRYRLVLVPLLAVGAGWALAHPRDLWRSLRRPRVALGAALTSAALLFIWTRYLDRIWIE